jgi:hypothetical protein
MYLNNQIFNNHKFKTEYCAFKFVNRLICCRVASTASAAKLGESPPGQDSKYRTWLCGQAEF